MHEVITPRQIRNPAPPDGGRKTRSGQVRNRPLAAMKGIREAVETVTPAIDQPAGVTQIALDQRALDPGLLVLQKGRQQTPGNQGVGSKLGLAHQFIPHPEQLSIARIVEATGELDVTPATKALAIRCALVSEIPARVVEVEGMATRRGVEA